jgi:cytochrome c oxidase subunit 2
MAIPDFHDDVDAIRERPKLSRAFPFLSLILRRSSLAATISIASGCAGVQSALAPAGRDADFIAALFWWMTGAALIIWVLVVALTLYYARRSSGERNRRRDRWLIVGGGVVFPTVTLTTLLVYGLSGIPRTVARAPEGSLEIEVAGEQWWWRVRYLRPGADPVVLANEVRLPAGETVQLRLSSDNVIHSFWIPSLAGKMDMIPGRLTYLALRPTQPGIYRGACAEYCGTSHARMAFYAEVMEKAAFERWLDSQAAPAVPFADPVAQRGGDLFLSNGCGACHTVRGTSATGSIGPDLTHVGSRLSLGAGILENEPEGFRVWLARTAHFKPGVHMPEFGMLPAEDLAALAAYLNGLK